MGGAARGSRRAQAGQALVEAVVTLPVMLLLVLGALQIMLIAHGRIVTEYAAFAAARAGIVHDGDVAAMRRAAAFVTLPVYTRTDSVARLSAAWLQAQATDSLGGIAGVAPVDVTVASPNATTFAENRTWQAQAAASARAIDAGGALSYPAGGEEIDFDDAGLLDQDGGAGRLAIEARLLYPLQIPFVNQIIYGLYAAQVLLAGASDKTTALDAAAAQALAATGVYTLPLRARYAMQAQSSLFDSTRSAGGGP